MTKLFRCLALQFILFSGVACGAKSHKEETAPTELVRYDSLTLLPSLRPDYAQGVSGHGAGVIKDKHNRRILWLASGCNFPEISAADGGAKRFYSDIYTAEPKGKDSLCWRLVGHLPDSLAYAAWHYTDTGAIFAGGQGHQGELSSVYTLVIHSPDSISVHKLPDLPSPRSGASLLSIDNSYYIIGGNEGGKLSTSLLRLQPASEDNQNWQSLAPYPGPALMKTLAWATQTHIYLIGSIAHSEQTEVPAEPLPSFFRYSIEQNEWEILTYPQELLNLGMSLGGGMVYQPNQEQAILTGGVNTVRFLPAIQRAQWLRLAKEVGDSTTIDSLKRENYIYLTQPKAWYQFATSLWYWQQSDSIAEGIWTLSPLNVEGRADAVLTRLSAEDYLLIAGEEKPGIRANTMIRINKL